MSALRIHIIVERSAPNSSDYNTSVVSNIDDRVCEKRLVEDRWQSFRTLFALKFLSKDVLVCAAVVAVRVGVVSVGVGVGVVAVGVVL